MSWRGVVMWECLCLDSLCPVFLVWRLVLVWMPAACFLRVCWLLYPWWDVFGLGVFKACAGCEQGLPLCSVGVAALSGGRVFSTLQVEALRIMFDHILLPLNECIDPQEVIAWSQWGLHCHEGPMHDLGRCPWFHSVVTQSRVPFSPFSVMLIPDLVQRCDVEEANVRH